MKKAIAMVIMSLSFTACTTQQVKQSWENTKEFAQENATVVGAVTGAIVGYAVSGDSDKLVGAALGALAGGLLSNQLAKYLNEKDRIALEQYSLEQLNNNETQSTSTWRSDNSEAFASVTTTQTKKVEKPVEIVKLKQVDVTPELELIGEHYVTKADMNVRYGPRVSDNKSGGMKKGTKFLAVGKTKNDWILAAQNGITIGYVKANISYIEPLKDQQKMMRSEEIDLDTIDDKTVAEAIEMEGIDLDSIEIDKTSIVADTKCRTIDYDVTSENGEKSKASFDACKSVDGAWELT